ncbi:MULTISPECIES: PAS domain S-box protein [Halorussus]|uniref:PAS domain S-box protein n=1 Tax=Halorussus TaxID=1070314 RepID=UPI00209FB78C|nr:PAS domain S-box protein [Halorussus vallis]USZ74683.1 PAS domain S-box protein [Halorussus vallis]
MDSTGPSGERLRETLAVFEESPSPGVPLTAGEVADALGRSSSETRRRLEVLVERGELDAKAVGESERVWWRPRDAEADPESLDARSADDHPESPTERDQQFRSLVEAVDDYAIFMLDTEGRVASWNEGAQAIKGYEPEEILGEHVSTFYTDEDREAGVPDRNLRGAVEGTVEDEGWRVRADGSRFWADVTLSPVRDADGALEGYAKVTRDMTEAKYVEAERTLLYSTTRAIAAAETFEDGLRAALEHVCEATDWQYGEAWMPDGDELQRASADYAATDDLRTFAALSRDYRFERGQGLPGRTWASGETEWMFDAANAPKSHSTRVNEASEYGIRAALGVPVTTDDEVVAVLLFAMTDARETDDRLVALVEGVGAELGDLVVRRQTEAALAREKELTDRILETSPTGIAVFDADGRLTMANERSVEMLGLTEDEREGYVVGERELLDPDGEPLPRESNPVVEALESGRPVYDRKLRIETPDGRTRWVSVNAAPLGDGGDDASAVVATVSDVTRLEEQARQLQRERDELKDELEGVFQRVDDAVYALDDEWRFTYVNERAERLLDRTEADLLGRTIWDVFPEAEGSEGHRAGERARETLEPVTYEEYYAPLES